MPPPREKREIGVQCKEEKGYGTKIRGTNESIGKRRGSKEKQTLTIGLKLFSIYGREDNLRIAKT